MKKILRMLVVSMVITMFMGTTAFAQGGLKLVSSYPTPDSSGYEVLNLMLRLEFDQDMSAKETLEANKNCFKVVDKAGKKQPVRVLGDAKNNNKMNVILTGELKPKADYKIIIDGSLQSNNGQTLGKSQTINFTTVDPSKNMMVTTVMMMGMMVLVVVFSLRGQKKKEEVTAAKAPPKKVNPYKETKQPEKGKKQINPNHATVGKSTTKKKKK